MARRYTIHDMHELAASRGGELLSDEYANTATYLRLRCANGHVWETAASQLIAGAWCGRCAKMRTSIDDMRALARDRGGECLSASYGGSLVKLLWACERGHTWRATPNTIKGGCWCPKCGLGMGDIDEMRRIARERRGECLSEKYLNRNTKLQWRCANGHEWLAIPGHVKRGSWCPVCAGHVVTIADMSELARAHGGRCLSTEYVNSSTPLLWKCRLGHEFEKAPSLVKSEGAWCPTCSPRQPVTLERLQATAARRGGQCLAKRAMGGDHKYLWECARGHQWRASASHVFHSDAWCPRCAGSAQRTIAEMREVARSRGGRCLSKRYVKSRKPLAWICAKGHRFEATPDAVVSKGRWCLVCKRAAAAHTLEASAGSRP